MRQHVEVGALHGGSQVRIGGAAAPALGDGHVHAAEAFLLKPVHIGGVRIPRLAGSGHPCGMQWVAHGAVTSVRLAAAASIPVAPLFPGLTAPEIRPYTPIPPTLPPPPPPPFHTLPPAP